MDEKRRRSLVFALLLFIFGSLYGSALVWLAFHIIQDGDLTWWDAFALHMIFVGYGAIYTLGDR